MPQYSFSLHRCLLLSIDCPPFSPIAIRRKHHASRPAPIPFVVLRLGGIQLVVRRRVVSPARWLLLQGDSLPKYGFASFCCQAQLLREYVFSWVLCCHPNRLPAGSSFLWRYLRIDSFPALSVLGTLATDTWVNLSGFHSEITLAGLVYRECRGDMVVWNCRSLFLMRFFVVFVAHPVIC